MRSQSHHPAVYVTAGFFFAVLAQRIAFRELVWALPFVFAITLFFAARKLLKLLQRIKYVALALVILFTWQTPGTSIFPSLGALSPTYDGLLATVEPLARLLLTVSIVSILLDKLRPSQWVSSLYVLLRPLSFLGFSSERFAVRLRLVMDYAESRELIWRRDMLDTNEEDFSVDSWIVETLSLRDQVLLVCVSVAMLGAILWLG